MAVHISESNLARDVHAILDRVQSGEEVIVERNAQPIAVLRATQPRRRKLSEIAAALSKHSTARDRPILRERRASCDGDQYIIGLG
jgi:antitoxin (DNA-binding transcriptional repressor) of toxin-antitoxin stability system